VAPRTRTLYATRDLSVTEYACAERRGSRGATERAEGEELVFVSRGAFLLETDGAESLVTPHHAVLFSPERAYRVSHPLAGGDDCVILSLAPELFARAAGRPPRGPVRIAPGASYVAQRRLASAAERRGGALETEELAYALVREAAATLGTAAPERADGPRLRRGVRRVEELLAARFAEDLTLRDLASEAGLSPWHLSRGFGRLVGVPLHRYRAGLRLRAALERVLDGARDLTSLALELGFHDHSHFTRAFRREFGMTPSALRAEGARHRSRSQRLEPRAFTRANQAHGG